MTTIPKLKDLFDGIVADLNAALGVSISAFGKAMLYALAGVQAAKLKLFYLAIGNLQKNIWADTAESVSVGGTLERFGYTKLQRYPFPATQGYYVCQVTGTTSAVIPALTTFKSDDTSTSPGFLFILDNAYTMPSTTGSITLRALTAGTTSVLKVADTLTATQPILNVNSVATVTSITTSPVDAETLEQYRAKVIEAYRISPQGGAVADYRLWANDAAGVRQSYPYTTNGESNEVTVYVEAILADSVGPPYKGVPTPTILTNAANDIETDPVTGIGRRPLGVFVVNTLAISTQDVDITIDSGGMLTTDQQTLITQAITDAAYDIRPFIAGIDAVADRNDTISTYGIGSVIVATVGTAAAYVSSITLDVAGSPVTSYLFDNGEIPYINSITYV